MLSEKQAKRERRTRASQIGRRTLEHRIHLSVSDLSPTYNLIDRIEAENSSYLHLQIVYRFQVQRKREEKGKDCILREGDEGSRKSHVFLQVGT